MSLCAIAAGVTLRFAAEAFTLGWTHTVEHTRWEEDWRVTPAGLVVVGARVKGSGAGMDPGPGAKLVDGWWAWKLDRAPIPNLKLAGSSAAPEGWLLCAAGRCVTIGAGPGRALGEDDTQAKALREGATLEACP